MMIDLPPQIEQIINTIAVRQGQSMQDFIILSAYEKALQLTHVDEKPVLVTDYFTQSKPLDIFKDIDPVTYQKAVRDEWD